MHYEVMGNGQTSVVLLHGWGARGRAMLPLAGAFDKCKLVVPDLWGFGNSPHPDCALTLDDYVRSVADLIISECNGRAVVVGHSFGGRIATKLAVLWPQLVQGIVLVNAAGIRPRLGVKRWLLQKRYKWLKARGRDVSRYGSADYCALKGAIRRTFVSVVNEDLRPVLGKVACPALILSGELDRDVLPRCGRIMARKIRNSEFVVIRSAGHFCYVDAPNVVRREIQGWFKREICQ